MLCIPARMHLARAALCSCLLSSFSRAYRLGTSQGQRSCQRTERRWMSGYRPHSPSSNAIVFTTTRLSPSSLQFLSFQKEFNNHDENMLPSTSLKPLDSSVLPPPITNCSLCIICGIIIKHQLLRATKPRNKWNTSSNKEKPTTIEQSTEAFVLSCKDNQRSGQEGIPQTSSIVSSRQSV